MYVNFYFVLKLGFEIFCIRLFRHFWRFLGPFWRFLALLWRFLAFLGVFGGLFVTFWRFLHRQSCHSCKTGDSTSISFFVVSSR
jgi:hypothetical protein